MTASTDTTRQQAQVDLPAPAINPYLGLALATLAVSFAAILIKLCSSPPLTIATYRLAITTALLVPLLRRAQRAQLQALDRRSQGLLVVSGVLLALHFGFWTASLALTSVANSVLFVSVHPALVAAVAWPLFGERLNRRAALGIGLTLAGSAAIAAGDLRLSAAALRGDGLAFLGAVVFAGYLLIGRNARRHLDNVSYSAAAYGVCACILALLTIPTGQSLLAVGGRDLLAMIGLAVICTLGGHLLFNWTLGYLNAALVSVSFLGEPVIAALLAWLFLGQSISGLTAAGGLVILAGIWLTARW